MSASNVKDEPRGIVLEYYQSTFQILTKIKSSAIENALYAAPRKTASSFFEDKPPTFVFEGRKGHELLIGYLNEIDQAIGRILRRHSLQFWLHTYRRIRPMLAPGYESKTDPMTTLLVRDHVECAITKYGLMSPVRDIRRSSGVAVSSILGGRFERDLKALVRDRNQRDHFIRRVIDGDEIVLIDFKSADFVDIYRVEGLAYEFWRTTALLRALGKGDCLTFDSNGDWVHMPNEELDELIISYDSRINNEEVLAPKVGIFVSAALANGESARNICPQGTHRSAADRWERDLRGAARVWPAPGCQGRPRYRGTHGFRGF
jgi:hypothetical protein